MAILFLDWAMRVINYSAQNKLTVMTDYLYNNI